MFTSPHPQNKFRRLAQHAGPKSGIQACSVKYALEAEPMQRHYAAAKKFLSVKRQGHHSDIFLNGHSGSDDSRKIKAVLCVPNQVVEGTAHFQKINRVCFRQAAAFFAATEK